MRIPSHLIHHPLQVPAYKMAPAATDMHLLRVCLRVGFDLEMADLLAHHIQLVSTSSLQHVAAAAVCGFLC